MGKALGILSSTSNTIGAAGNIVAEFDLLGGPWGSGTDFTNHVIVAFDAVLTLCLACAKEGPSSMGSPPTLTGTQTFDILKSSDGGVSWVDLFGLLQIAIDSSQGQTVSTLDVFATSSPPGPMVVLAGDILRIDTTVSHDAAVPPNFATGVTDATILLLGTPL